MQHEPEKTLAQDLKRIDIQSLETHLTKTQSQTDHETSDVKTYIKRPRQTIWPSGE
jgi:hypothetical protein